VDRILSLTVVVVVGSVLAPAQAQWPQEYPVPGPYTAPPGPQYGVPDGPVLGPAMPSPAVVVPARPVQPLAAVNPWTPEPSWYTRIDYFHWGENIDGADFVNEDGALVTLGYVRRVGRERFRAELFGGSVNYSGLAIYENGETEPLSSHTNYLGVRGEYDLLFEPDWLPQIAFFCGIGTRFWVRELPDSLTPSGAPVYGYQETWWTIYPYVGMEKRRLVRDDIEFYAAGRIGLTAITLERVSLDDLALYPGVGLLGQLEAGVRGRRFYLSAFFEAMSWGESDDVRGCFQPQSEMYTVGLRTGFWL